ncbi:MAG: hypothetical protein ACI8ZB_003969 [Desulforhopalus sp.]|jgi:hypothetical protein
MALTVIEKEIEQQYQVQVIGRTNKIREKFMQFLWSGLSNTLL